MSRLTAVPHQTIFATRRGPWVPMELRTLGPWQWPRTWQPVAWLRVWYR